jgi:hypothetical protein
MMAANQSSGQERQVVYAILLQGRLSQRWLDWLGDMTILAVDEAGNISRTTAELQVPDQAALLGQLQKLHNLGYQLLKIRRLDELAS